MMTIKLIEKDGFRFYVICDEGDHYCNPAIQKMSTITWIKTAINIPVEGIPFHSMEHAKLWIPAIEKEIKLCLNQHMR